MERVVKPKGIFLVLLITLSLVMAACGGGNPSGGQDSSPSGSSGQNSSQNLPDKVRIGYHPWLANFLVAIDQGFFEEAFSEYGVEVEMVKMEQAGPIIDGMKAGQIDLSSSVSSFVVAGTASGADLVVLGTAEAAAKSNAIIVPGDSPIQQISDLRGKKVAVVSGSNSHIILVRALESVGLTPNDIELVPLNPTEAVSAFASGAIDAWAIWDPFRGSAELGGARTLFDNEKYMVITDHPVARKAFYDQYPDLVKVYLEALLKTDRWMKENPDQSKDIWASANGFQSDVAEIAWGRRGFDLRPFNDVDREQIAIVTDFYLKQGIITSAPDVESRVDNSLIEEILAAQ